MSSPNGKVASDRRSPRGESPRRRRSFSRERIEKHREKRERDDRRRSRSRDRYRSDRRSRSRDRSRHRDKDRDRDRERDHDRDRERERRHERHRDRDRERDREDRDRRERRRKREDELDRPMEDGRSKRRKDEGDQDVAAAGGTALSNDDDVSVSRSDRRDRSRDSERKHSDKERHSSRHSRDDDRPPRPKDDRDRDGRRRGPPQPKSEDFHPSYTPPVGRPSPRYDAPFVDSDNEPEVEDADSEARSVFVSQLAARLTAKDLGYFFEDKLGEGSVKDARIVTDRLSKRSKGIGYVEFKTLELVPKAIALSGTIVMGLPIMIQLTESERNKTHPGDNISSGGGSSHGSQIYVGSLHFNLTESDIKQVFEPFGELDWVDLHRDPMTGRSKGYCFIQYKRADDARMALEQMEGFELAGRQLRVKTVHEKGSSRSQLTDALDEGTGGNLNAASRQALMQKLARSEQPSSRTPEPARPANIPQQQESRCVLLKNMFDPDQETEPNWDRDLAEDVKEECERQYGKVDRLKVERDSEGEIYVRFGSIDTAKEAVKALNGRWFGGRQVSAHYISDAIMQAHQ